MNAQLVLRSAALLLFAVLAGCASAPPAATLLALPSLGAPGAGAAAAVPSPAPAAEGAPLLVVRRPVLPEYLLARRVRYRADAVTVDDWPGVFWAERIEVGLTRELTAALRAQLPGWTLCEAECAAGNADVRAQALRVELAPLDFRRDRRELYTVVRAVLQSPDGTLRWRIEQPYTLRAGADTPQAHAAVLGELLQRVAADLGPALREAAPLADGR